MIGSNLKLSMNRQGVGNNISDLTGPNVLDCILENHDIENQMHQNILQYVRDLLSWLTDYANTLYTTAGQRQIEYLFNSILPQLQRYWQIVDRALSARSQQRPWPDMHTLYLH